MVPPAPPRLSITTCWPRISESFAASGRATVSVPPPGGNGTIILIGLLGQSWAAEANGRSNAHAMTQNDFAMAFIRGLLLGDEFRDEVPVEGLRSPFAPVAALL